MAGPIRIADVVYDADIFQQSILEATTEKSRLFASGIIQRSAEFDRIASGEGNKFSLPFWKPLSRTVQRASDQVPIVVNKTTMDRDIAVKHFLRDAWAMNGLTAQLAGEADPLAKLAQTLGEYWMRVYQQNVLIPSLNGIFATALASTHVSDISIADGNAAGEANLIGPDAIIDAVGLLGDNWDMITGMAMHSAVFFRLQKLGLIEDEQLQEQTVRISTYQGKTVIVDDGLPRVAGGTSGFVYTTVFFGANAVAYGDGGPSMTDPDDPFAETDRDSLAGDNILINRRNMVLHPRGVAFIGTPADGITPSEAELATGANWQKKWQDKNIPLLALKSNG